MSTIVETDKGGGLRPEPLSTSSTSKRSEGMHREGFHHHDDFTILSIISVRI